MTWIYKHTPDNSARFVLGEPGDRNLVCIGVNPSTAEPNNLDNTLKTVKKLAGVHGFDGWIMLNLYPQRATNPNDMHAIADDWLLAENLREIKAVLALPGVTAWAAWGTLIEKRPYLASSAVDIIRASVLEPWATEPKRVPWVTIGKRSKAGHPHHPLYLNHSAPLEPFDAKQYHDYLRGYK